MYAAGKFAQRSGDTEAERLRGYSTITRKPPEIDL
jgi:hypothetical protein